MWVKKVEEMFLSGNVKWHPFFTSAYGGGGFTLGAGYLAHVRDYDTLDMRGSYTFSNYKRLEAEYVAPRLFARRARLSILGGWREAPQVNFFGVGNDSDQDAGTNYGFRQPYLGGCSRRGRRGARWSWPAASSSLSGTSSREKATHRPSGTCTAT